jgi:hypothetical protein
MVMADTTTITNGSLIINELLTYCKFYRSSCTVANLRKVVLNFYSTNEIATAKNLLISRFPCLVGTPYTTGRRGSTARPQHEAELDDVVNALDFIDNKDLLSSVRFVAETLDRVPKYGPEEINVCAVVDRQRVADGQIMDLVGRTETLENATNLSTNGSAVNDVIMDSIRELDKKVSTLSARIENTNSAIGVFSNQINNVRGPPARTHAEADLSMNLIISGVDENRDPQHWRGKIDEVLKHVVGRPVDIVDIFRVGRYRNDLTRPRPVIVKLRSVWDHRLILSSRHKLKNFQPGNIFINPDEALDVRRKKTLNRLKMKYEADGKTVNVTDGSLFIDNVMLFSLENGFVQTQQNGQD